MRHVPSVITAMVVVCAMVGMAVGVADPAAAPRQTPPVTIESVMTKATAYVETFVARFSNVVTEEYYKQAVRRSGGDGLRFPERREWRSDLLITEDKTLFGWIMLRDVFEVDGKPVRDREGRLTRLLTQPDPDARVQAMRIANESARYNIGPGARTTNTPEMSILFLQPSLQTHFTFTLGSRERSLGDRVWVVTFRERTRPTLVRGEKDTDMPASGRLWIDAETGQVARTELNLKPAAGEWSLTTDFKPDERLGIAVPVEMKEYFRYWATETTGTATYGRFRSFGVNVNERVGE